MLIVLDPKNSHTSASESCSNVSRFSRTRSDACLKSSMHDAAANATTAAPPAISQDHRSAGCPMSLPAIVTCKRNTSVMTVDVIAVM